MPDGPDLFGAGALRRVTRQPARRTLDLTGWRTLRPDLTRLLAASRTVRTVPRGIGQLGAPPLPAGRIVELPGRGPVFLRTAPGPDDAVPVLLLHGLTLTADVNFWALYQPLARHHPVIAMDVRNHGRGIRDGRPFRIERAADDAIGINRGHSSRASRPDTSASANAARICDTRWAARRVACS